MQPYRPARSNHRALALALSLGALVILAVATVMTAQAFVTKTGETTLDDFASGEFHRTGLLDMQPDIDSIQLLPIGLFGQWELNRSLPVPLTELAAVATGGHLVVIGGSDDELDARNEVYVASVGADGLLGPWAEQTDYPLPHVASGAAAATYPKDETSSWIYLLGGTNGFGVHDQVYWTTLDHSTGEIGPWLSTTEPLSVPVYYHDALALNGYVYVIGGYTLEAPWRYAVPDVYFAPILADGDLGPWQPTEFLPEALSSHRSLAYSEGTANTLYVVGGWDRTGGTSNSSFHVYFADVNPDGTLAEWQLSGGNLPSKIFAHGATMISDQILVTGGRDENNTISDTVKAALVDPGNPSFRLYDWCTGVPPPCTIGAWQSGALLPEKRAFHATVSSQRYVYTIGGVGLGVNATDSVYYGSVDELGALYSPWGSYISSEIDFGMAVDLRHLVWGASIDWPDDQTLDLSYRYQLFGGNWQPWSTLISSHDGEDNEEVFEPPISNVRRFQYRIDMTTDVSYNSPRLDWIDIYYEVDDPDVAVIKNTDVMSVSPGTELEYTIHFTNSGEWVAPNVVLTETLPEHTTFAGGLGWQQVDSSDVYTYHVGDMAPGVTGELKFRVQVQSSLPQGTRNITNHVEINYPPLVDILGQPIDDPTPHNNSYELSTLVSIFDLDIAKGADPPPGSTVLPGDVITYNLIYTNSAAGLKSTNTVIVDLLPQYASYVSGSITGPGADDSNPQELRWNLGSLPRGASGQVGFSVRVSPSLAQRTTLENRATIDSDQGDLDWSNVVTHLVDSDYDVEISQDSVPPPDTFVGLGSQIAYTIRLTNTGKIPVTGAVLTDTFDLTEDYTVISTLPDPDPGTTNVWSLGTLAVGETRQIDVVVQLKDILPNNWPVTNKADVRSDQGPVRYGAVVTHTTQYPPSTQLVDLTVTNLRMQPPDPGAGDPVSFLVDVANIGTADAGAFWVELYVKPSPSDPPARANDHEGGYFPIGGGTGRLEYTWNPSGLASGMGATLSFPRPGLSWSDLPFPLAGTQYDVYVQVDLAGSVPPDNAYWGIYPEDDEMNNIVHITYTTPFVEDDGRVFLPLVAKK